MKKFKVWVLMMTAALLFTSCAGNDNNTSSGNGGSNGTSAATDNAGAGGNASGAGQSTHKSADGFVFEYAGTKIALDQDMSALLDSLGEPQKVFEADSCAFVGGTDRVYGYPGVNIHTYPDGDKDYVLNIDFKDDSITTPEGIFLGCSLEDMKAAYGDDYEQELEFYTYRQGLTYLSFSIKDDMVVSITYGLTV